MHDPSTHIGRIKLVLISFLVVKYEFTLVEIHHIHPEIMIN